MSPRVPNGWGDPSTERHLQVPPRYATGSRAAKLHPLDSCPVPGGCIRCWSIGPHATPGRAAETYVGDFIGSQRTHIIRVGFDPRPGWGRAVCGAKGHIPEAKDTPVVTCLRCFAWAKKNRPENVG